MAVGEVLLQEGLKKLAGGAGRFVPGLGQALTVTTIVMKIVDKHVEEVRDDARAKLGCNCIEVCPEKFGGTPTSHMVNYAAEHHGMAFKYNGFALCHPQADFDVNKLSSWVLRWNGKHVVLNQSGGLHIQPCLICVRKERK